MVQSREGGADLNLGNADGAHKSGPSKEDPAAERELIVTTSVAELKFDVCDGCRWLLWLLLVVVATFVAFIDVQLPKLSSCCAGKFWNLW